MDSSNIRLQVDGDGVALITLDVAQRSVNVFTPRFTQELAGVVQQLAERADIIGAVITSGKAGGFMAGADLTDFVHVHDRGLSAREAAALVAPAAETLRRLERGGKPVAAAINGFALGGGYELCLACHHRVLVDHPKAVVGLPEVTVGLLPAGGGTQRLPRLIGIAEALPLLLSGRHVGGAEALRLGLVDALVPADELLVTARRWVLSQAGFTQPWDRKAFAVPGGAGALATHANESFSLGMAKIRRDTQDNLPAPAAIVAAVYEGTQVPIERGLAIERACFGALLAGPVARNLMRTLFVNKTAARKLVRRPAGVPQQPVHRLGVLGAGMMGCGIAHVAANAGIEVVLIDTTPSAAEAGKSRVAASYTREMKAGRCTSADVDTRLARIHPSADYGALRGCDFVVEAVFEERSVKARAMRHASEGWARCPRASSWPPTPPRCRCLDWPRPGPIPKPSSACTSFRRSNAWASSK